ncbi:MAG: hypothetical protein HeimC2_15160 [Candidatus Heimdallarchaeota archaeon LC_2]|nr:MAG: hypothetical protein HeimC2_15160 [Candidatus Heimdallarchaeota archaeon LC_2]
MISDIISVKDLFRQNPILEKINLNLCVKCKGTQLLCGLSRCPLIQSIDINLRVKERIDTISKDNSIFGPSPQVFLGSSGYPNIYSGPMTSLFPDNSNLSTNPSDWVKLSIEEIIELRFGLLRGMKKANIYFQRDQHSTTIKEKLEELARSTNPVEIEGALIRRPSFDVSLNAETQPMGPSGMLSNFSLTSNPKIPNKVDSVLSDELLSSEQMNILYNNGFDIYYLQNIFSTGGTGLTKSAKMVPTRWSITATDDIIGKELITQLYDFTQIQDITVFQGNLLGNYFTACLFPGNWQFENFETWLPGGIFTLSETKFNMSVDREGFQVKEYYKGRSSYAKQAGGYYASRLGLLEYLHKIKKQAKIVIFREITSEYTVPVGVWCVREGVRKTMNSAPIKFLNKEELKPWLNDNLRVPSNLYFQKSELFSQSSLMDFFK